MKVRPLGEWAVHVTCDSGDEALALAASLRADRLPGQIAVNHAYSCVGIVFEETVPDAREIEDRLAHLTAQPTTEGRTWRVPVCYEQGEDLEEAALALECDPTEVIQAHLAGRYRVEAVGFSPGFGYCSGLRDPLTQLPRRPEPRTQVPAGSVAVAAGQAAIYPEATPGGWWILGRTPLALVRPDEDWIALKAGDLIQYKEISNETFDALARQNLRLGEPWENRNDD